LLLLLLLLLLLPLALLQVWYTASTAAAGRSGSVRSSIKAHAGPAKGKLRIAGLVIAGVPQGLKDASPSVNLGGVGSMRKSSPARAMSAVYDAAVGTLKISDIDLDVGQELELLWSL
jgi:hypothetical protein